MPKPIVTDTYDFPTLIRNGNVYVDKTAYLHRLVSKVDGTLFFMSRPRRFGKSLMISTLEQIFKGNKALFTGLDIPKAKYDWKKHPKRWHLTSEVKCVHWHGVQRETLIQEGMLCRFARLFAS